jgi:DNA-directed RNA polymerase subunit RPC12/RpoP
LAASQRVGLGSLSRNEEGGELPLYECPNCEQRALVDPGPSGDLHEEDRWVCFACGARFADREMDRCARCGEPFDPDSGAGSVCRDCLHAAVTD